MSLHNLPPIHFGIVTILPEEFGPLLDHFPTSRTVTGAREYNLSAVPNRSGFTFNVAIVAAGERGTGEAQSITHDLLGDLEPRWVLLVGIAGARPDRGFTLGDVILATR